jgi:hypothetical protein
VVFATYRKNYIGGTPVMEISEDEFKKLDAADRDLLIFRNLQSLSGRRWANSCIAFFGGVVGGFAAVIANWAFFGSGK